MLGRDERFIRHTLRQLSRQRVAMILPGGVLVIEHAVESNDERVASALHTCLLRGWVEILVNAVPNGDVGYALANPGSPFSGKGTLYRTTDSGWSVIHRDRAWALVAIVIAAASLVLSAFALHSGI